MEDKEIKELEKAVEQIWEVARGFGLDPYPTNFEIVPATAVGAPPGPALRAASRVRPS